MADDLQNAAGTQRRVHSFLSSARTGLPGPSPLENSTNLVNSERGIFNPNKSFRFSHATELPYTKLPATVKPSSKKTVQPTSIMTPPQSTRKRKAPAAKTLDHEYSNIHKPPTKMPKTGSALGRGTIPKPMSRRKRKTKGPPIQQRAIPRSFEECDEADQLLVTLRDGGAEWEEIVARWKALTGEQKVGKSTLPNRYNRLKENFSVIREEDSARLIEAKREVEEAFETSKWSRIALLIRGKGGDDYPPVVLQRQYKKLMLSVGARPPPGVRDPDFEGVEPLPPSPELRGGDTGNGWGYVGGKEDVDVDMDVGMGVEGDGEETEDDGEGEGEEGGEGDADWESD